MRRGKASVSAGARLARLGVVLIGAALWASAPALARSGGVSEPPPVLSPASYDRNLASFEQALQRQVDLEADGAAPAGASPRRALAPILHCQVRDPAGRWLVTVDNTPLALALSSATRDPDVDERRSRYQALLAQIALLRKGVEFSPNATAQPMAVASMRQVLSQAEFSSQPVPPPSIMEKEANIFWNWLRRLIDRLHGPKLPAGRIDPRVPLYILIGIAIVAAGVLIAYIVSLISRRLARRTANALAPQSDLALSAQEASLVATRDFERLLDLARRRGDDRDYRSALRLVYLATLVYLDSEGVVRLNRSKTNWEYLRAVRAAGHSALYAALQPVTQNFDRIWYGLRPAGTADYDSALAAHAQIRSLLVAGGRPSAERRASEPARAAAR